MRRGGTASRSSFALVLLLILLLPGLLSAQARLSPNEFFDAFLGAVKDRDTSRMDTLVRENKGTPPP